MSTAVLTPATTLDNDVVFLRDVSWAQYRRYRAADENRGLRMYYANGDLLLMTTGSRHERLSRLTALALLAWAESQDVEFVSLGRWTLKQDMQQQGLEPDDCYYVSHLAAVRGRPELDLAVDPPPDLAIEIDVTTHSAHKFSIYAGLRVAELWVWQGDRLRPYRLTRGTYKAAAGSKELPGFPFREVSAVLLAHVMDGDLAATQALRRLFAAK